VRRSEDGKTWENVAEFYHTNEQFFEFFIKGFTWYVTFG